jgi:hypothetical protein
VEFSPRSAAPRFQIDSSDAFYPPLWENDWKSRGIGIGHTVRETDYSLGGSVALVNVGPRDDLVTYKPRWPVQFPSITHGLRNTLLMSIGADGQWGAIS